jgi:hypothetical protein
MEEMVYRTRTMEMADNNGDKTEPWPTPTPADVELTRGDDKRFHEKDVVRVSRI